MNTRGRQHPIERVNTRQGPRLTRRQLLQGAGAVAIAAVSCPTAVFGHDDDEPLGAFGPWSEPVNLGPKVNSEFLDSHPAISKSGLSLYITSSRPGGVNGATNLGKIQEIWVAQRASLDDPWGEPRNLDAFNSVPVINSPGYNTGVPNFSTDGHLMFFNSPRPGGCGGADLYVSRRRNKRDDFGWQAPVNLGCTINSAADETAPTYFEDEETGTITLYFTSTRLGGPGGNDLYVSTLGDDGSFGPAVLVPELNTSFNETRTAIRRDGLEMFIASNRPGGLAPSGIGANDIWVSTRETTTDSWSTPVNLGRPVNSEFEDGAPALSWDGTAMYFYSRRPVGFGDRDLWATTRVKLDQS